MAEIKPIKAWRYNTELQKEIENLTSPLFDVVSPKQREALYKNPLNSIHLSVPKGGENSADMAADRLAKWKKEGIFKTRSVCQGFIVYDQYFNTAGFHSGAYSKRIQNIYLKLYDWDENCQLRHENNSPKSVNDRH